MRHTHLPLLIGFPENSVVLILLYQQTGKNTEFPNFPLLRNTNCVLTHIYLLIRLDQNNDEKYIPSLFSSSYPFPWKTLIF